MYNKKPPLEITNSILEEIAEIAELIGHVNTTAAFTLDTYGHVTEQMKLECANRMEAFIQSVSA